MNIFNNLNKFKFKIIFFERIKNDCCFIVLLDNFSIFNYIKYGLIDFVR